jgi:CBS domain-containing protein
METNSGRFLKAFRSIEQHLRKVAGSVRDAGVPELIGEATRRDPSIARHEVDLHKFRKLRNVLVHGDIDGTEIAWPSDLAVERIERVKTLLTSPPRVVSVFRGKVLSGKGDDPVGPAIRSMMEQTYSQMPVYDGKRFLGLLTMETVARFLGEHLDKTVRDLRLTPLREVLNCTECEDAHIFIPAKMRLTEVLMKFEESDRQGKRIQAMLITREGGPDEKLIGIITIWDIPRIHERL